MNIFQKATLRILFGANYKAAATMIPSWFNGSPTYAPTNYENLVREGWRKNELIYSCIARKSATASQVKLKVYDQKTGKEMPDHPLQLLIKAPNPAMSEYDLWRAIIIYQDLSGRAAFEKEKNNAGKTIRLWPLRPDWLHPMPSTQTFIGGYTYEVPGAGSQYLKPDEVLDFKIFDPIDQYNAWPPVAVAARVGQVDNVSTDYIKLFFEKGGVPPGIIKTTQKLRDTEVSDIRRRWGERYGGILGWLQPAVLDRDAEYQQTGLTFKDMGFDVLDARNESRICGILQVPPILVGAKVGLDASTYSNYREARTSWWEDTLVPIYVDFISTLVADLASEWPEVYIDWDFTGVPALREEKLIIWQRANEALRWGGLTINEYRLQLGFESIGEQGDIFLRPLNMVEVNKDDGTITPLSQPQSIGKPIEGEPKEEVIKALFKAANPSDRRKREMREKRIKSHLDSYFSHQRSLVEKELSNAPNPVILE